MSQRGEPDGSFGARVFRSSPSGAVVGWIGGTVIEEARMDRISGLDQLYDASYRRLVVQMYAICGSVADAEDAVQEAFVVAIRKERELRNVANVEAWVRTTALNRLHR